MVLSNAPACITVKHLLNQFVMFILKKIRVPLSFIKALATNFFAIELFILMPVQKYFEKQFSSTHNNPDRFYKLNKTFISEIDEAV